MTDILVTGGNGFIGRKLILKLQKKGYSCISLNSQNGDITKIETFLDLPKVKYVFHLAAKSYVPESWNQNNNFFLTNLVGTKNVLDYCKRVSANLIMASSYVYGIPQKLPIKEDHIINPNNPYALSKSLAEKVIEFEHSFNNINSVILRIFNIYGIGQNENFLIPKIIKQIKNNENIKVFDLNPKRDFVYIDDVIEAFIKALELKEGLYKFNIGSGKSFSVEEIISIIQKIANTNLSILSEKKERRNEIFDVCADISHAKKILNWKPKYSLQDGLKKYLNDVLN